MRPLSGQKSKNSTTETRAGAWNVYAECDNNSEVLVSAGVQVQERPGCDEPTSEQTNTNKSYSIPSKATLQARFCQLQPSSLEGEVDLCYGEPRHHRLLKS